MAEGVEALSWRADYADMDCRPQGFQCGQNSSGEFERLQSHVDGKHDLFSFRPQWSGKFVRLRHCHQASIRSGKEQWLGFQVGFIWA